MLIVHVGNQEAEAAESKMLAAVQEGLQAVEEGMSQRMKESDDFFRLVHLSSVQR